MSLKENFYSDIDLHGNILSNSALKKISLEKLTELPTTVSEDGRVVVYNDQLYQYKKQTTVEIADLKLNNSGSISGLGAQAHGTMVIADGVPMVYNLVPNGEDYPTNISFETTLQATSTNAFEGSDVPIGLWLYLEGNDSVAEKIYYQTENNTVIYQPVWEVGGEWKPISADQDLIADLEQKIDGFSLGIKNKASAKYRAHSSGIVSPSAMSKTEMLAALHDESGKTFETILQENGHNLMSYLTEHSGAARSFDRKDGSLMLMMLANRRVGIEDLEILTKPSGVSFRGMEFNSREDYLLFKKVVTGIVMNFSGGSGDMSFDVNDVFITGGGSSSEGPTLVFTSNSTLQFDPFENKQVTLSFMFDTIATDAERDLINSYSQDTFYTSAQNEWVVLNEKMTEDSDIKDQRILFSDGVYTIVEDADSYKLERSQDMLPGVDATGLFLFVEQGLPDISEDMGFLQTQDDVTIAGGGQVTFERFTGVSTQTKKTVRELKNYVSEALGATELASSTVPFSKLAPPPEYNAYMDSVLSSLTEHQDGAAYLSMFATPQVMGSVAEFTDSELEGAWTGFLGDGYRSNTNPTLLYSMWGFDSIPVNQPWNDLKPLHKLFFYLFCLVMQEIKPQANYPSKFAIYSLDENNKLMRNPDMERYAKIESGYNGFTQGKITEVRDLLTQTPSGPWSWRNETIPASSHVTLWLQVIDMYETFIAMLDSRLRTLHIPVKSKRVSLDKYVVIVDEMTLDPMFASPFLRKDFAMADLRSSVVEVYGHVEQHITPTTMLSIRDQQKLVMNRPVYGIPSTTYDPITKFFFGDES